MGANFEEVSKELFALLGYKDGERFFKPNFDPRVNMLQEQIQKLQKGQGAPDMSKVQIAQINAQSKAQSDQMRADTDRQNAAMDYQTQKMEEDSAMQQTWLKLQAEAAKLGLTHAHEHRVQGIDLASDHHLAQQGMQSDHFLANQGIQSDHAMQAQSLQSTEGMAEKSLGAKQDMHRQSLAAKPAPGQAAGGGGASGGGQAMVPSGPDPESARREDMLHEMAGNMQTGMGSMMQAFVQTMAQFAQNMQQGNQQIAQSMQQIGSMIADAAERSDQNLEKITAGIAESNQAVAAAMGRKRTVLRGPDGRVAGVE
jgi:hypothetical protein